MNNTTNSEKVSGKIMYIRRLALGQLGAEASKVCPTCTRAHDAPFRGPVDERGRYTLGCVDAIHSGHLYGESLRWHERPEAQTLRRATLAHLESLGRKILVKVAA